MSKIMTFFDISFVLLLAPRVSLGMICRVEARAIRGKDNVYLVISDNGEDGWRKRHNSFNTI